MSKPLTVRIKAEPISSSQSRQTDDVALEAALEWSDELSVGVRMFDDEHKKLLGIIAALRTAIADGDEEAALCNVIDRLIEYTFIHFRHEEMYFADCHYPRAEVHVSLHVQMRLRVLSYRERLRHEPVAALALEMLEFLHDWLSTHIKSEDKLFGQFLQAKGYGY